MKKFWKSKNDFVILNQQLNNLIMKDYQKITQVFDLFVKSVEIGEKSPFFSISITPHDESMRLLCWLESNSDLLAKIESVYKVKFVPDDSNDLCAEFNINNVLIHLAFCV